MVLIMKKIIPQKVVRTPLALLYVVFSMAFPFSAVAASDNEPAPPEAVDDYIVVVIQNEVIFNVLDNDRLHGIFKGLAILDYPKMGTVRVKEDHTLSYIPKSECDQVDRFTYVVSNEVGLDTVAVFVEILCEKLTIFSGFSPNGDGIDDVFTIKGIENFPDNSLSIFDYTGQEIYRKKHYINDWDGSELGEPLSSEFTYFYVFDDGEGHFFSGYFKVDY